MVKDVKRRVTSMVKDVKHAKSTGSHVCLLEHVKRMLGVPQCLCVCYLLLSTSTTK